MQNVCHESTLAAQTVHEKLKPFPNWMSAHGMEQSTSLISDDTANQILFEPSTQNISQSQTTDIPPNRFTKVKSSHTPKESLDRPQSRDESLRQELASIRRVNEAIEGVISCLERARENVKVSLAVWIHTRI